MISNEPAPAFLASLQYIREAIKISRERIISHPGTSAVIADLSVAPAFNSIVLKKLVYSGLAG